MNDETQSKHRPVRRVSASEMAKKWGLSVRRVRKLCAEHKIFAAKRNTNGEWRIPITAERPIDGRSYRYRKVPSHFRDLIRHVDVAVDKARKAPLRHTPDEMWLYFARGSAHHLHKVTRSSLNFSDVCELVAGRDVPEKKPADCEAVRRHCRALDLLAEAVRDGRRFTLTLVRDFYCILEGRAPGWRGRCGDLAMVNLLIAEARNSKKHPVIQAGNFMTEMDIRKPLPRHNEQIGYLIANFMLMRREYPPIIIYRCVFTSVDRYLEQYQEFCEEDADLYSGDFLQKMPKRQPPVVRSAFINSCVAQAVLHSCRKGLLRASPVAPLQPPPD